MTPGKFLRLLWAEGQGFYCIAHPFKPEGSAVTVYAHKVFPTISEAVTHVHEQANLADTYFAILTLEHERVWDPEKTDFKTGQKGAYAIRKQDNMLASKAVFFDLDVGSDAGKYATQQDAFRGLATFLVQTKLPQPTLVSSGGGIHCYWHFDQPIPTAEWREIAWHMRQLAEGLKLLVDPTRTIDSTSVLRVPGTYNWKDRTNPREVKALQEGQVTSVTVLKQMISDAMIANGIAATPAPVRAAGGSHSLVSHPDLQAQTFGGNFGPEPTVEELGNACAQVREIIRSQVDRTHPHYGPLDNTAWYRGMLATFKHAEGGEAIARQLTALHPRSVSDIDAKLQQLEQFPPAKCTTLQQFMPWKDTPCQGCRFRDKVPNPFAAARKTTPAPPPGAVASPAAATTPPPPATGSASPTSGAGAGTAAPPSPLTQLVAPSVFLAQSQIPNPPKPYERLKTGEVAITKTDKDGNVTTSIILHHDLYPLKRLVNAGEQKEQHLWRATLPRAGARDFTLDADALYDGKKFTAAIAHNGVFPHKADIPALQDYMVAYISQLQKNIDADAQANHLGWSNAHHEFILPDKTLCSDGSVKPSSLATGAERAAQFIRKQGDANRQVQLMSFYSDPKYIANQYVVLQSLASIIFDLTGHHGIVVNCSGHAGASKSTSLYTAAGLWGDPILWPINGTEGGATAKARMQRITTNANLPTCVDEITHMSAHDAKNLVMGITQPGSRLRLDQSGAERKVEDGYKSAIMIATANSSLHSIISQDGAAGTAGSMRVFEIKFEAQGVHTKAEADEYLRQIKLHYGHIGELFAHFVVRNRSAIAARLHQVMADVDTRARILSSERFWSGDIAATYVAAEIARALGLMPYDPEAILSWAVDRQVPYMRGIVKEEYREPLALLTDYIAEKHGSIVIVDRATSIGANTTGGAHVAADNAFALNKPNGALLGHFDIKTGVLLLLKNGIKDYCSKFGASSAQIMRELSEPRSGRRIVIERDVRRTLGAGTDLAKGQAYCYAIDMTHPDMAGVVPTVAASGGQATSAPAGNLKVVK